MSRLQPARQVQDYAVGHRAASLAGAAQTIPCDTPAVMAVGFEAE
jgi:hypothetical protein